MTIKKAIKEVRHLISLKSNVYLRHEELLIDDLIEDLDIHIKQYNFLISGVIFDLDNSIKNRVVSDIIKIHRRNLSANFRPVWEKVT